jgi:hypothetical protein
MIALMNADLIATIVLLAYTPAAAAVGLLLVKRFGAPPRL